MVYRTATEQPSCTDRLRPIPFSGGDAGQAAASPDLPVRIQGPGPGSVPNPPQIPGSRLPWRRPSPAGPRRMPALGAPPRSCSSPGAPTGSSWAPGSANTEAPSSQGVTRALPPARTRVLPATAAPAGPVLLPWGPHPSGLRPPPRLLNWSSELTATQRAENTPTRSFSAETIATTPGQGPRDKPPQPRAGERHRNGHLGNLSRQQVPRHLTLRATPETKAGLPARPWPGAPALRRGSRAGWTPRSVRASDEQVKE